MMSDAFAAAARPSKGGFVRDALTSSFPKLVGLLEAAFNRIQTESRIKVCLAGWSACRWGDVPPCHGSSWWCHHY